TRGDRSLRADELPLELLRDPLDIDPAVGTHGYPRRRVLVDEDVDAHCRRRTHPLRGYVHARPPRRGLAAPRARGEPGPHLDRGRGGRATPGPETCACRGDAR